MKNRKREICTSGSVRGEDGNILTYSAGGGTPRMRAHDPIRTQHEPKIVAAIGPLAWQSSHDLACRSLEIGKVAGGELFHCECCPDPKNVDRAMNARAVA